MLRRASMVGLAAVLLTLSVGCRKCSSGGWFTSGSRGAPCQLMGRSNDVMLDSTGLPIGAAPGTFGPGNGVPLMPGAAAPGGDLPFPQPNDLIPRPGVPVPPAIPTPAPGEVGAGILPVPKIGVPVKGTK